MRKHPLAFGKKSEAVAARFLRDRGCQIIDRNYRTPMGELDLVARHGDMLVFVEVKARRTEQFGDPAWAVDRRKQKHLIRAALAYMAKMEMWDCLCRFDVVGISEGPNGRRKIEWIPNAFEVTEDSM